MCVAPSFMAIDWFYRLNAMQDLTVGPLLWVIIPDGTT